MKTKIIYYLSPMGDNPIGNFITHLQEKQQAKILRLFRLIEEYGLFAAKNHLKKLIGTPFWEMRILGQDNIRFLYLIVIKDTVLILNCFFKKEEKTPIKEIALANSRYKEWMARKTAS
jgi:phage-related protein